MSTKIKVLIMEAQPWWGFKTKEIIEFDTYKEAEKYVSDFNTKYNNSDTVPEGCMIAKIST